MRDVPTLGYALLGLLARGALSGYDLARQMRRPVGYFWQARRGTVTATRWRGGECIP